MFLFLKKAMKLFSKSFKKEIEKIEMKRIQTSISN